MSKRKGKRAGSETVLGIGPKRDNHIAGGSEQRNRAIGNEWPIRVTTMELEQFKIKTSFPFTTIMFIAYIGILPGHVGRWDLAAACRSSLE